MNKVMTADEMRQEMGLTGEKIVSNMLNSLGLRVEHAINKFDNKKDFVVDGRSVEVKTQTPNVMKDCFSFRSNQLQKCKNVDVLYIVTVPHPKFKHFSDGKIYRIDTEKFRHYNYTTRNGIQMVGIPIRQEAVIFVKDLEPEEVAELKKYIITDYN